MFAKPFQVSIGLSTVLLLVAISPNAEAVSTVQALSPNQPVQRGLQFNVQRTSGADFQPRFVVEIIPQNVQLPGEFQTFLSVVHQDSHSVSVRGSTADGGRRLNCAEDRSRILCDFTVPDRALESLSFVLDVPVQTVQNGRLVSMPAADMLYFNLRNVPPMPEVPQSELPQTEAPQKNSIEPAYEQLGRSITAAIESLQSLVQSL